MEHRLEFGRDTAAAEAACRERLRVDPRCADSHRRLAMLHLAAGDSRHALLGAEQACALAPDDARCWSDLGRVHARDGRLATALEAFEAALRADARHADAWHNLGVARHRLGDDAGAFVALKTAVMLDGARAQTWLVLGNLLVDAAQLDDAIECFERAATHDPSLARARSQLAVQLAARGRVKRAEGLFRESLSLDPAHVPGWLGLASVLEDLGEADAALANYRHALERSPGPALALGRVLALDSAPAPMTIHVAQVALDDESHDAEARALIGYGLARHHDRAGRFEAAARAAQSANAARRQQNGELDRAALEARVDGLIQTCNEAFFAQRRGHGVSTSQPVFVVGLPRSGTTLTEQILGSHPLIHGAGELNALSRIAASCVSEGQAPWEAVQTLDAMRSRDCASRYLEALRDNAPRARQCLIDKAPLNFFHLGFIALLFPNARIVHCHRGLRDNALSIWMENFNAAQHYATDFDDLAFFHAQYRRLMIHWQQHLPLPMFECRYESTVADVEGQARALLGFLELPWDSRCLEFHRSERTVQTPSRWQVRQPIYSSSIGRSRHYQPFLPQLVAAFPLDA